MCESPTQETTANYYEVKMKLEQISLQKTEGAMIWSKARWCEQREGSTSRETKSLPTIKYITNLREENCTLTSLEIL